MILCYKMYIINWQDFLEWIFAMRGSCLILAICGSCLAFLWLSRI